MANNKLEMGRKNRAKIMRALEATDGHGLTVRELAMRIDVALPTVRTHLTSLENKNMVEKTSFRRRTNGERQDCAGAIWVDVEPEWWASQEV